MNNQYMRTLRNLSNVLLFVQIGMFTVLYRSVLFPLRRAEFISSMTFILDLAMAFCLFSIIFGFLTMAMIRTSLLKVMIASNGFRLLTLVLVLGSTIGRQQRGSSDESDFEAKFIGVLETHSGKGLQMLHEIQHSSQCCGVPLKINWNQSLISLSNPWSSWYHYTILTEEYIDEARRLFTLPWSCCSATTPECEHLAFERVSIDTSNKDIIIEELVAVDQRLGSKDPIQAKESVFEKSCGSASELILPNVPIWITVATSIFDLTLFLSIGVDGILIWKLSNATS